MAKKRLNKNLIVSLTLFTFVMMIVVAVLMIRQLRLRDPQHFVELARQYAEQEQWKTAALFYKKAWTRGHDANHLVALGDALLHDGSVRLAREAWATALVNQPDLTQAHRRQLDMALEVARLYGRDRDWQFVRETAETFTGSGAAATDDDRAMAGHAVGLAQTKLVRFGAGDMALGEASLRDAVDLTPGVVEYGIDLALHFGEQDHPEEAEQLYKNLTSQFNAPGADAATIRTAYAVFLAGTDRFEEAQTLFERAMTLAGSNADAALAAQLAQARAISQRWMNLRRRTDEPTFVEALFSEAEQLLQRCVTEDPDNYDAHLQLAALYGVAGRHENVLRVCDDRLNRGLSREGVAATRNRLKALRLMIFASDSCLALANAAEQEATDEQRLAWLDRADEYIASAQGEFSDHPRAQSQAGRVKLARGLDRQALEDFRRADESYRSYGTVDWKNKFLLAQLHLRMNEAGAAREVLEAVLSGSNRRKVADLKIWLLYAQTLLACDAQDRALNVVEQVLAASPTHPTALRVKAAILERRNRPGRAGEILVGEEGEESVVAILTARELSLNGQDAEALDVLRDALKKHPADLRLVTATVRGLVQLDKRAEALSIIEAALVIDPESRSLKTLAVVTRTELSPEQRDESLLEIIKTLDDPYQRSLELVGFHLQRGQTEPTLRVVEDALMHLRAKDTPLARRATIAHHRALLQTKLSAAAVLDDADGMASARDEAATYDVDGAGGQSILGLYHMLRREYGLAAGAFESALAAQPTNARTLAYLGQCHLISGRLGEAKPLLDRAVRSNPKEGQAHKGLAMLAKARNDQAAYDAAMEKCRSLIGNDPWVQAELLSQKDEQDPIAALALREERFAEDPNDLVNLSRLAALAASTGDIDKADTYYAKWLEQRPDDRRTLVGVAKHYRQTQRPQRSLDLLTQHADTRTSPSERANAQILIASHYLSLKDLDQVERTLRAAAEMEETFEVVHTMAEFFLRQADRPAEALPWLDKAVDKARNDQRAELATTMAMRVACLLHRAVNDLPRARVCVDELLTTFPNNPRGLLLSADVYGRVGDIDAAVDTLTDYLRNRPDSAVALYQRALHRITDGRISQAISDLETIKRHDPMALDLRPRRLLARLKRQIGGPEDGLRELESLVADAPNSDSALETLIQAYQHAGRLQDAERVVTARINRTAADPKSRWFVLRSLIAMAASDASKALADARRACEIDNRSETATRFLLDVYVKTDRASDGIRYLDQNPPTTTTALTRSKHALLLATAGRSDDAVAEFQRAMSEAVRSDPDARALIIVDVLAAFPSDEGIERFASSQRSGALGAANDRILMGLYQTSSQYEQAIALAKTMLGRSANDAERADLQHALGDFLQASGNAPDARRAYEESLKYEPQNWIALNNLAYLLSDVLGDNATARGYAERAVEIAENASTLDTLGWIHVGLGDFRSAIADLGRAIQFAPDNALTYYHLAEAYRRSGRFDRALDVLKSASRLVENGVNTGLADRFDETTSRAQSENLDP